MKIEDQVCTFEQAKRLKELGFIKESVFGFYRDRLLFIEPKYRKPDYYAYTVAELGELLPFGQTLTGWVMHDKQSCAYYDEYGKHKHTHFGETEAEARAAMLIYLIESKVITPQPTTK